MVEASSPNEKFTCLSNDFHGDALRSDSIYSIKESRGLKIWFSSSRISRLNYSLIEDVFQYYYRTGVLLSDGRISRGWTLQHKMFLLKTKKGWRKIKGQLQIIDLLDEFKMEGLSRWRQEPQILWLLELPSNCIDDFGLLQLINFYVPLMRTGMLGEKILSSVCYQDEKA